MRPIHPRNHEERWGKQEGCYDSDTAASEAADAKGKKSATALKKARGDWVKFMTKEANLVKLHEEGLLPPADLLLVRAPSQKEVLKGFVGRKQ